jgi:hypothetical protein
MSEDRLGDVEGVKGTARPGKKRSDGGKGFVTELIL